jgi:hypothetical protein
MEEQPEETFAQIRIVLCIHGVATEIFYTPAHSRTLNKPL